MPPEVASRTSHIVIKCHNEVRIDDHQVIVLGMGYECGDGCQRSGKSQTGFKGAQTSGGQVGHTVAVII